VKLNPHLIHAPRLGIGEWEAGFDQTKTKTKLGQNRASREALPLDTKQNNTMKKKTITKTTLSLAAAVGTLALATSANAATILYDFTGETNGTTDKSSDATTNDFGAGVTASAIIASTPGDVANYAYFNEETTRTELRNGTPGVFTFTITIDDTVSVDLTGLSFLDGIDSGAGGNDLFHGWELAISNGGSANIQDVDRTWLNGTDPNPSSNNNNLTLSGLTGLTDTTVTFTLTSNFATGYDSGTDTYSGGGSHARHTILDDITLTGAIAPAPFVITAIDYDPDADTVTLTWRKTGAAIYIAWLSYDMSDWGEDLDDSISPEDDERPEDTEHITMSFLLKGDRADAADLFFRIEEG
jgi:hypothetical protein